MGNVEAHNYKTISNNVSLKKAEKMYNTFNNHEDGCIKVVMKA